MDLGLAFWSLGRLGYREPPPAPLSRRGEGRGGGSAGRQQQGRRVRLSELMSACVPRFPEMNAMNLSNVLWGTAVMSPTAGEGWTIGTAE